ncbi:VOC family protein [Amycolatopsis sp. NPDC005003]
MASDAWNDRCRPGQATQTEVVRTLERMSVSALAGTGATAAFSSLELSTKYGTEPGSIVLGRVVPFGIGAVVGRLVTVRRMNFLDHVLLGVRDLEVAADRFRHEWGLGTVPGGSPVPGVANAVVPLEPPVYLELVTATDPGASEAAARLAAVTAAGDRLFTWAMEPDDLDACAASLGVEPVSGGGDTGRWRLLGEVEQQRPFFIEYDIARAARIEGWQRTYAKAMHDCAPGRVTYLEVGGDESRMRQWVGEVDVPLRWVGGEPRLAAAGIATTRGEIVVR